MQISFYHNLVTHHFEIHTDEETAYIEYEDYLGTLTLYNTHIPYSLLGKDIFKKLAEQTFNYINTQDYKMVPRCPLLIIYLNKHPEYQHLIGRYFGGDQD
jgi:predicted GNAT family acetyltransferase